MIRLISGIALSAILIWLSLSGVTFEDIINGKNEVEYIFLIPSVILFFLLSFLRSLRWGIILSPMEKISQRKLYPITCVGYMAVILIPMRVGEILRPYLVNTSSQIPMGSGIASVILERLLDAIILFVILFVVAFNTKLPIWVIQSGYGLFFISIFISIGLFFIHQHEELSLRTFKRCLKLISDKIETRIEGLAHNFVNGLRIISNLKQFSCIVVLSILIWALSALGIYCLYLYQNFQLPISSAFVVLVLTTIGVSLPTAPGYLGNFQFACIVALSFYGIEKSEALLFSLSFYLLGVSINLLLGFIFLPFVNISFKEIRNKMNLT